MASRRIYITLNSEKEKDRIILKYLSSSYSEKDAIKEALYRLAIQSNSLVLNDDISAERVQLVTNNSNKVKRKSKPKSNIKVEKGNNSTSKVQKGKVNKKKDDAIVDIKDIDENNIEVKNEPEIRKNELEQLQKFM